MSEPVRSAVAAEREYSDRKIVFDYCSGPAWPPVCRTVSGLAAVSESGRRVSGAGFFCPVFSGAAMTITAIAAMARISPMIRLVMVVLGFKHFDRPQHDGVDRVDIHVKSRFVQGGVPSDVGP